ncbi:MAG: hypothetical protein ACE5H1_01300 [Thermodesulfobacteriota bacterium]
MIFVFVDFSTAEREQLGQRLFLKNQSQPLRPGSGKASTTTGKALFGEDEREDR